MNKTRVLIVEDEIITAIDLETCLTESGYNVCGIVASGIEAMKKVDQQQPDVVLMNIDLQGKKEGLLTGYEINSKWAIPVIFTSGYIDVLKDLPTKNNSLGYVSKPYTRQEVLTAIENIITNKPFL